MEKSDAKLTDRVQDALDYRASSKRSQVPADRGKKKLVIRVDEDVINHFMAGGRNWEAKVNSILRKAAGLSDT